MRKEKFSLVKLMSDVNVCLTESTSALLSGVRSRGLVESYCKEISNLLNFYILNKKLTKNPVCRKTLRKETAKKFFDVLERLGIKVYNWLLVLPEGLQENDFNEWKGKTEKGENKDLTKYVSNAQQVKLLRENLDKLAGVLEDMNSNKRLRKLVEREIEAEPVSDIKISSPEIVKK